MPTSRTIKHATARRPASTRPVAWVIGAAGTIGQCIARALAGAGYRVVLSSRRQAAVKRTARSIGGDAFAVSVDLARRASVDRAASGIFRRCGRIDVLVNCAAIPVLGDFLSLADKDWEDVLQTKWLGYMRSMRAVIPGMITQGGGAIVNISGRGGRQPTPAHLPGCSANIAVNLLSKGLADVYAPHNIRINAVAPGPIESERHHAIERKNINVSRGKNVMRHPPLGRLGRPEEIADAVVFLASKNSSFITGTTLQVDGGGTACI
jgi:NAD(P)-dependent dehydrogenase (short-subunit alcohol dehydrogenase family)